MATVIQIKRSGNATAPSAAILSEAELAYSQDKLNDGAGAKLYIESVDSSEAPVVHAIGGKYYTDLLEAATSTDTANAIVRRDFLANFQANTITANTIIGPLVGEAESANISSFANALTTPIFINLSGDIVGSAQTDLTGNIDITSTVIQVNAVALGDDTTGEFVGNITPNTSGGLEVTGYATENAQIVVGLTDTGVVNTTYGGTTNIPVLDIDVKGRVTSAANVAISTDLSIAGDSGSDAVSLISETLQFTGNTGLSTAASGNTVFFTLDDTSVSADTYGGTTNIPVLTIDAQGRITSASNAFISTDLNIAGDSGSDTVSLVSENLQFTGNTGISTSASGNTIFFDNDGVTSLSGTANEVEVSGATGAVTIGLPDDVVISGNLTVNGTAITINSESLEITDPIIHLAANNYTSDTIDIGFEGHYFDSLGGNVHAGLVRDASDSGKFKLFENVAGDTHITNTVDFSEEGYRIATLVANLEGGIVANLLSAVGVSDGGTGKNNITTNAILYGQGTGALAEVTGTFGQILQINESGIPVFSGVDGGTY